MYFMANKELSQAEYLLSLYIVNQVVLNRISTGSMLEISKVNIPGLRSRDKKT